MMEVWLCVCLFSGHRGADCYKAMSARAEWQKQGEMVSGDPDHEKVRSCIWDYVEWLSVL